MANDSKNNEVYKIEIEIDNLTREQYDSMWKQLRCIQAHSDKDIEMNGGRAESSHEEKAALPLQNVINWVAITTPPTVDYFYLVYDRTYGAISKALYDGEFHLVERLEDTEITHWAHLPKPPCL